jgi:hypothetical protein
MADSQIVNFIVSRAFERAHSSIEGKPRRDYSAPTSQPGYSERAAGGVRYEETLAKRRIEWKKDPVVREAGEKPLFGLRN